MKSVMYPITGFKSSGKVIQAMVLHGRYICVARAPRCWECKLIDVCPYADKILAPAKAEKESAPRRTITGIPILPR